MNYFTSCLYGDYEKYMKIKKDILHDRDHLWIIGDILDGNEDDPEAGLMIVNDIMSVSNITLILGDHEYARCMEHTASGDAERASSWRAYSDAFEISGKPLNDYISSHFSRDDRELFIADFLAGHCELSAVVPIGGRFFYLVHGRPELCPPGHIAVWQAAVCEKLPEFTKDYWMGIRTDDMAVPFIRNNTTKRQMTGQNTIIISGQASPSESARQCGVPYDGSGVFFKNNILAIGRKYTDEPVSVIGIDAAGFFVAGIY